MPSKDMHEDIWAHVGTPSILAASSDPLSWKGLGAIAGLVQSRLDQGFLPVRGDGDQTALEIGFDLGLWIETLNRSCDSPQAGAAMHVRNVEMMHDRVLSSQGPGCSGPFHDGKVKRRRAGYSGYMVISTKDVIAAAYLLRVALLSRIMRRSLSGVADRGRKERDEGCNP